MLYGVYKKVEKLGGYWSIKVGFERRKKGEKFPHCLRLADFEEKEIIDKEISEEGFIKKQKACTEK